MAVTEQFGIDDLDRQIIELLQDDPDMTHSAIAKKIGRSQPAVGARIHRLEEKGILSAQYGINFRIINELHLIKVELSTSNPNRVFEMSRYCPFIINCMRLSGENNLLALLVADDLKKIDMIIDYQFRNKEFVENVEMEIITDIQKDFILPVDLKIDNHEPQPNVDCAECAGCEKGNNYKTEG